MTDLFYPGRCETAKAGTHAALLGLAAVCALYSAAAFLLRRQPHLAVNTVTYALLCALETAHVRHHAAQIELGRRGRRPAGV